MKRRAQHALAAILPALLFAASSPAQTPCGGATPCVCGQIVLRLQPGETIEGVNSSYGATVLRSIPARRTFLLGLGPQANAPAIATAMSGDARIAWAEPNFIQLAPGGGTQSFFLSSTAQQYTTQYATTRLDLAAAHAISTGTSVTIAVLDSGLDAQHPLFAGRIAPGGFNFVANSPDFSDVGNGLDDDGDGLIDEMTGHGTFVAGLSVLASPGARILPLKVLNSDGVGTAFHLAQAIDAASASGASVINISLGSTIPSRSVLEAVNSALAQDHLVVAAAGNSNRQDPPLYPAAWDGVIGVAATDENDLKAGFSDYGPYIAVSAPGAGMVGPFPGGLYSSASGTSFAAPLVSGTAALARALAPGATRTTVAALLGHTSTDISTLNPSHAGLLGAGRIHAGAAAAAASAPAPCYANCDGSTSAPVLNVADFSCFLQRYAAGDPWTNCDQSTTAPVLNVQDFGCFLAGYAAGCP
ncbi:MAG: S8 family serine peptidase [Phycisphaerales bacterium]